MIAFKQKRRVVVVAVLLVAATAPLLLYRLVLDGVPSVSPVEAEALREEAPDSVVMIDVRSREEYQEHRIRGSVNWPLELILALDSLDELPDSFRNKQLLLICESGILSVEATRHLHDLGVREARNVRGGIIGYVTLTGRPCPLDRLDALFAGSAPLPYWESPRYEQWAVFLSGFGVKTLYEILSLAAIIVLWRRREADLSALRWGFIFFLSGELACATNYFLFHERSYLWEFFHSLGMVAAFGFAVFALLEGLDARVIRYSDAEKRCAALSLCRDCYKQGVVACGFKRSFHFLIPAFFAISFLPLCATPVAQSYNTTVLDHLYNCSHAVVYQLFEIRLCPAAALVLFGMAFFVLIGKKENAVAWSKVFFAGGAGALGFSLFRLFLFGTFRDDLIWFIAWEEITEFLFVSGTLYVLWVFRRGLLGAWPADLSRTATISIPEHAQM